MNFILIFGPPAVGKMTVGKALAKITDFKLFHNHMSIELVRHFFDFGHPNFRPLDKTIRFAIFQEAAASDLKGLIFTFVWAIDQEGDCNYVDQIISIFKEKDWKIHFVELMAPQSERLKRNLMPDRLTAKASKRNIAISEKNLLESDANYRLNTQAGDLTDLAILKIDNTHLSATEVAMQIKTHFKF